MQNPSIVSEGDGAVVVVALSFEIALDHIDAERPVDSSFHHWSHFGDDDYEWGDGLTGFLFQQVVE